jgi:hypothetical protein
VTKSNDLKIVDAADFVAQRFPPDSNTKRTTHVIVVELLVPLVVTSCVAASVAAVVLGKSGSQSHQGANDAEDLPIINCDWH